MKPADFRKELIKIMPGYSWTIHRPSKVVKGYLSATGIQSSGFNRLSTLRVNRREKQGGFIEYEAKSSGYGLRAPWLSIYTDKTLARALRGLQNYYATMSQTYAGHASALEFARGKHQR